MTNYARFEPLIQSPYPESFQKISDFVYETPLFLMRNQNALKMRNDSEVQYVVAADYTVSYLIDGIRHWLTVPRGMLTDLASVPRFARSLIGRVGPHLEASIVHDFLFIAWQLQPGAEPRYQDFRFANAVMFAGLDAAAMGWHERLAIRVALQFPHIAWSVYQSRDDAPSGFGLFVNLDEPAPSDRAVA